MTEPNAPIDPAEPTEPSASPEPADEAACAWLRGELDRAVAAPVRPGWELIAARLGQGEERGGHRIRSARLGHRHVRAGLAIAAGLLLVTGALVVRPGHRNRTTDRVATQPDAPTGWYVPVGLPAGWTVTTVTASAGGPQCAGRGRAWSDPDRRIAIGLTFDGCGHAATQTDLPSLDFPGWPEDLPRPDGPRSELRRTDLGHGIVATEVAIDDPSAAFRPRTLTWEDPSGGAWSLTVTGLDGEQVVGVARSLATDPTDAQPAAARMATLPLVDHWSHGARATTPEVQIGLASPGGLGAGVHLHLPGDGPRPVGQQIPQPVSVPGASGPTVRFEDGPGGFWAGRYGGTWSGADVTLFRWTEDPGDKAKTITDAELEVLLGSLRPATTEQWRRFLDTATVEVSPALRTAATLADIGTEPSASTTSAPRSTPSTTSTTTPTAPTTPTPQDAPTVAPAGWTRSDPGELRSDGRHSETYTSATGLEIWLEIQGDGTIAATRATEARIAYRNTTARPIDLTECTDLMVRRGLVPADQPDEDVPGRAITDCYATTVATIGPGQVVRRAFTPEDPGFTARTWDDLWGPVGGALAPGPYLAVAVVPTREGEVRAAIPVTVEPHPCGLEDGFARSWLDLAEDDARTRAAAMGLQLRVVRIDGTPQATTDDLRCDRIDVELSAGRVRSADRY